MRLDVRLGVPGYRGVYHVPGVTGRLFRKRRVVNAMSLISAVRHWIHPAQPTIEVVDGGPYDGKKWPEYYLRLGTERVIDGRTYRVAFKFGRRVWRHVGFEKECEGR
jgi:hypothetical protein